MQPDSQLLIFNSVVRAAPSFCRTKDIVWGVPWPVATQRWRLGMQYSEPLIGRLRSSIFTPAAESLSSVLQDQTQDAIDNYHKALALKPEDSFVAEMLTLAMQDSAKQDFSF